MSNSYVAEVAYLVLVLPLIAFAIQIFFGRNLPRKGDWVSLGAIVGSLAGSLYIACQSLSAHDPQWTVHRIFDWFRVGNAYLLGGVLVDNLTAVMLVVVTGVSTLVHIYSTAYMHGDPKYSRYFGFLSLFSFSMLGLILADNIFFLYCFWELVGVSSYFLIGFWNERQAPADAAKKAFLTNRVGDIGFFLGIMILWHQLGTFSYVDIFQAVRMGEMSGLVSILGLGDVGLLTLAGLCLFCGAVGKSAQFPLHVWLPDAMEGPTPVSALIHAATMVAAGVYMVGRLFPLFTPSALLVIAYVGCITAFFAGTIAITANDIKRVLAYSTVSQLGYMIMALGVGGYTPGLQHLMTHAWFKALLFLCSGSVILGLHHTQDMREMGGLRKKMPVTFWTMLIGTLALCGVPPFSGFFSKDAILAACLEFGIGHPQHLALFVLGVAGAGITTFYMFRLIFMTFYGEPRNLEKYDHAQESPLPVILPLVILAALAIGSGWGHWFQDRIQPPPDSQFFLAQTGWGGEAVHVADEGGHGGAAHTIAMLCSILAVIIGFGFSYILYFSRTISPKAIAERYPTCYRWLLNKYYVDEFYQSYVIEPLLAWNDFLFRFDRKVIDGFVNGVARTTRVAADILGRIDLYIVDGLVNYLAEIWLELGQKVRRLHQGRIQEYLVVALALAVLFILGHSIVS